MIAYTNEFYSSNNYIGVPFPVHRLRSAKLVWLNIRYFLENGINATDKDVYEDISKNLLDEYGVMAPENLEASASTDNAATTFVADRYGGSIGAAHGGSGRCGIKGGYNAKGIGRTPLVPHMSFDWHHEHGFLWLSEAIREAIASEVAIAEMPYGAIPIVAIIDTGMRFKRNEASPEEHCAIVIRPNFIRPAHFERSIYFGSAGTKDSDQYQDALRVKTAIDFVTQYQSEQPSIEHFLTELFRRIGFQLGASRALRLWQGRLLSSNISIDGALVDFGAFRSVANWRCLTGRLGEEFGNEGAFFDTAAKSLSFYFTKYSLNKERVPGSESLLSIFNEATQSGFFDCCAKSLGLSNKYKENILQSIQNYYAVQQEQRREVDDPEDLRLPWFYDFLKKGEKNYAANEKERKAAIALYREIDKHVKDRTTSLTWQSVYNWFRPRPYMYLNVASKAAEIEIKRASKPEADSKECISNFIDRQISRCRRYWNQRPHNFVILGQRTNSGQTGFWGINTTTEKYGWWMPVHHLDGKELYWSAITKNKYTERAKFGNDDFLWIQTENQLSEIFPDGNSYTYMMSKPAMY